MAQMNPNVFVNKNRYIGQNKQETAIFWKTPYKNFGIWIAKSWIKQAPQEDYVFFSIVEKREYEIYQYEKKEGKWKQKNIKKVMGNRLLQDYNLLSEKNKKSFNENQKPIDPFDFLETKKSVMKTTNYVAETKESVMKTTNYVAETKESVIKNSDKNINQEFLMSEEEFRQFLDELDEF